MDPRECCRGVVVGNRGVEVRSAGGGAGEGRAVTCIMQQARQDHQHFPRPLACGPYAEQPTSHPFTPLALGVRGPMIPNLRVRLR